MTRSMRVLLLTADYAPNIWSGIGSAVTAQACGLFELGIDIDVLTVGNGHRSLDVESPRIRGVSSGQPFPFRAGEHDVIHLHSLSFAELAFELRSRYGGALVYTAHSQLEVELHEPSPAHGWARLQDMVMESSDIVVVPSEAELCLALERLPHVSSRLRVVPNGIGMDPGGESPDPPEGPGPVVFSGRFTKSKGVDLLAAVVQWLAPHEISFVLAGGHGDSAGSRLIADLVAAYPDTCRLTGWLEHSALLGVMKVAGAVMIPSSYEPFGMVALEAMSVGSPVIAADVGGLGDMVASAGGRVVSTRDPAHWAEAVLQVLDSPRLRREMSRRGRAHVARNHDPVGLAGSLVSTAYVPALAGVGAEGSR